MDTAVFPVERATHGRCVLCLTVRKELLLLRVPLAQLAEINFIYMTRTRSMKTPQPPIQIQPNNTNEVWPLTLRARRPYRHISLLRVTWRLSECHNNSGLRVILCDTEQLNLSERQMMLDEPEERRSYMHSWELSDAYRRLQAGNYAD